MSRLVMQADVKAPGGMWSANTQGTPANGMGVPTAAAGPFMPWYYQQMSFWCGNQMSYDPFEYARHLSGSYNSQSQLLQHALFNTNENVAPIVQTDPSIDGLSTIQSQAEDISSDEDEGNFQELLRNIRSLSPSSNESNGAHNILLSETIVDIEDDEDEEQQPCTSTVHASAESPNIVSISGSSHSSPILRQPFPSPQPVSPSPPGPPAAQETSQKEGSPVLCDFFRRCSSQRSTKDSAKTSLMMALCSSLANRQLPKCGASTSSAFQERVRAWKDVCKRQRHDSRSSAGVRENKVESVPTDRSKERQALREMGSYFPELRAAEEQFSSRNKPTQETRNHRVGSTGERADDTDSALASMRSVAAVPPPLSDVAAQAIQYYRVERPMKQLKVEDHTSRWWNEEEKEEFRKRFKQYGKMFGAIAHFLPNKSASDCAKYYNFKKHAEEFKALRNRRKGSNSKYYRQPVLSPVDSPISGVRLKSSSLITLPRPYEAYITCSKCHTRIASNDLGILTRSTRNSMYPPGDIPRRNDRQSGAHLCTNCRKQCAEKQFEERSCPVFGCTARPRRCREHRSLPAGFFQLSLAVQEALLAEYRLSPTAFKCCYACFNKIKKKVSNFLKLYGDEIRADEPSSSTVTDFTEEEQSRLRDVLFSGSCSSWDEVAAQIPKKTESDCRRYAHENSLVIFDVALLTNSVEQELSVAEENTEEVNQAVETNVVAMDNIAVEAGPSEQSQAAEIPYACLRAVLNGESADQPIPTSEQGPEQGTELPAAGADAKSSWNIKFAFHPSDPFVKLQQRKSADASLTVQRDPPLGAHGVASSSENANVDHRGALVCSTPSELEFTPFTVRSISGGRSSISSETSSGVQLSNLNYQNNYSALLRNQNSISILPLSLGPENLFNNWYTNGLPTNGAGGEQPVDLSSPKLLPIAEHQYSRLYSPNADSNGRRYPNSGPLAAQQQEPRSSANGPSNLACSAEERKRHRQGPCAEEKHAKVVCNGIPIPEAVSTPNASSAYAGIGPNSLNGSLANGAYPSLNGFAYGPTAQAYQYLGFPGHHAERSPSLVSPFNLNGYCASPYYAAGSDYGQVVQNGLLRSAGIPLFNYGFNPYGYAVDAAFGRRIVGTPETAIPAGGSSSTVDNTSAGAPTGEKRRVEQIFTFLNNSDDDDF